MQTALVTGATSGVGRAIAEALATSGRKVFAVGRDKARLDDISRIENVVPVDLDIRDRDALARLTATEAIDILVNNAGLISPLVPFDEMDVADIDAAIAVNITAGIVLTNLVIKGMRERQRGHVFFTGS